MKQVVSYEQRDDDRRYQLTYQNKIQGCSSDSWYVLRTHVQISKSHKCRVRYGQCPSWVTSGHFVTFGRCPLYPPKAGMSCWLCNVRFCQEHISSELSTWVPARLTTAITIGLGETPALELAEPYGL
jgi:hypothetical protein